MMSLNRSSRSPSPLRMVWYLLGISIVTVAAPSVCPIFFGPETLAHHFVLGGLLLMQFVLLALQRVGFRDVYSCCARSRWLFVFLLVIPPLSVALFQSGERSLWTGLESGLESGLLMSMQVATIILSLLYVQSRGSPNDLAEGLRRLRLPTLFVHTINHTLALVGRLEPRSGKGRGQGKGKGRGRNHPSEAPANQNDAVTAPESMTDPQASAASGGADADGPSAVREAVDQLAALESPVAETHESPGIMAILRRLARGDVGFFIQAVQSGQERALQRLEQTAGTHLDERMRHDIAWISGIAVVMISIKVLKILPGVPFLSGFKIVLLIPMYVLATHGSYTRWGATVAGCITGIMSMMMGDAPLEIAKHVVAGVSIDLLWPIVRLLPRSRLVYCALGLVAALAWVACDPKVGLIWVPALSTGDLWKHPALLLPILPKVSLTLFFGTASGFLTYYALKAFGAPLPLCAEQPPPSEPCPLVQAVAGAEQPTTAPVESTPQTVRTSENP